MTTRTQLTCIQSFLDYYKLSGTPWDVLIIGDGSGSSIDRASGWASFLLDRHVGTWEMTIGGMISGVSIAYAELMAPYAALRKHSLTTRAGADRQRVHIWSDNQYAVEMGNQLTELRPGTANADLWKAYFELLGTRYSATWYWLNDGAVDCPLHRLADQLSVCGRTYMESAGEVVSSVELANMFPYSPPAPGEGCSF